jgi:polyisoprenoid-binding protein YceI
MTATTLTTQRPGYQAGTWTLDLAHSELGFTVRHLMVSKVRGKFGKFDGRLTTGETPTDSSAEITVDLSSIDTGNEQRDTHLRSADFFDVEKHPTMTFRSTGVRENGEGYLIDGELTIHGVTRPVTFQAELNGFGADPWGGTRLGLTATTEIQRSDFGITWNGAIEGGGVVVSDKVTVNVELEAVLAS